MTHQKREAKTRRDSHRMIFFTVYDTWSTTLVFVDGFRTSCKQFQGTRNTMAPKWKTSGWKNFPGAIRRELGGSNKTTKGWISYNYKKTRFNNFIISWGDLVLCFCFWNFMAAILLLMAEILHQLIGSLSHYLQGSIHPRWCRISAINRMTISPLVDPVSECLYVSTSEPKLKELVKFHKTNFMWTFKGSLGGKL